MSHVKCHMSDIRCQVSGVRLHKSDFFFEQVVELVGGGSVINEAYLV